MVNGRLILFGCGGHSRSVADIVLSCGSYSLIVFVDQSARENEKIFGFSVLSHYEHSGGSYFFAIGDNKARRQKFLDIGTDGLVSVVSNKAHIGRDSVYGLGCFIGNYCHVGPEARIGANTILNNASIVEHEVIIGNHCHIGPGATISGRCKIGDLVFIGVGATVKDYIQISSQVTIGAGATVVKDISEPGVYVGTPARRIK